MKKTLLLAVSFLLLAFLGLFLSDAWRITAAIQKNSQAGTLRVGHRYNASQWASPLPLKKIHAYTAVLAPSHEVVITTDQELVAGREYFIRFISRSAVGALPSPTLRPAANSIRKRLPSDGAPVVVAPTAALDRFVDKAMGSSAVKAPVQTMPAQDTAGVPFLIGGATDKTFELIWNNSRTGEWIFVLTLLVIIKASLASALFRPWREQRVERSEEKDFIHPSLRPIEADAPPTAPRRIAIKRKATPAAEEPAAPENPTADETISRLKLPRK